MIWQLMASMSLFLGLVYLQWRVLTSFNENVPIFSGAVMVAEVLAFFGLILFYFDIWAEKDTERQPPPHRLKDIGGDQDASISVDIFITTFDEPVEVVRPSIEAALNVRIPDGVVVTVHVLDDGARPALRLLCEETATNYLMRQDNRGYKAGNLREAILKTQGNIIVICDADTRLFDSFLENTLGYFRDTNVSWVQTPHWFYDIPEQRNRSRFWLKKLPFAARSFARMRHILRLSQKGGGDPFMNSPDFFFDVIQRRRNRNNAAFCCGAGSLHRREALLEVAMIDHAKDIRRTAQKLSTTNAKNSRAILRQSEALPFQFHVSEDIFTSIRHHRRGWKSVYHPQVEARMLSPRSISSWAMQRMKYAGGTFDIMRSANPVFMRGMPWKARLHYLSTFWSYISVLWLPILLLSPAISLLTGWSPVKAYSLEFFRHLLPFLIIHEIAVSLASKGHDINLGRSMNIGLLPMHLKAGWNVLRGRKPTFVPTPKIPLRDDGAHLLIPHIATLVLFAVAALIGIYQHNNEVDGYSTAFVTTNMLWLLWNTSILLRTVKILFWRDPSSDTPPTTNSKGRSHASEPNRASS